MAPPTQGTWRSNDYVSAVRLVDTCSMEWVVELFIYTFRWSTQTCATTLAITSQNHISINITFTYVTKIATRLYSTDFILDGLADKYRLLIFKTSSFRKVVDLDITICLYSTETSLWMAWQSNKNHWRLYFR